jgi:structural maintenance of chromosome 3 (chondroitin sulfate proteoglycan 6)
VVDTDQTAQRVLDKMIKDRSGRVTFMPLNRLKPKNPTLPSTREAFPLIDKLRFDERHKTALQQVFGKTCIAETLEVGAAYVRSHGIDTITLDGDRVDRKGALSGGYHDVRRSRLSAIKSVTQWRARRELESARSKELKAEITQLDQEITKISGQIQVATNAQTRARTARDSLVEEERRLIREMDHLQQRIAKLEEQVEDADAELVDLNAKLDGYEQEKRSPLSRTLTDEEASSLERLVTQADSLQQELIELGREKAQVCYMLSRSKLNTHRHLDWRTERDARN